MKVQTASSGSKTRRVSQIFEAIPISFGTCILRFEIGATTTVSRGDSFMLLGRDGNCCFYKKRRIVKARIVGFREKSEM